MLVKPKFGSPVTKSRTSARNPNTGRPVLKSSPPPYSIAPLLLGEPALVEKRAQPPPTLNQGEIGAAGRTLRRSAGVMKMAEVSNWMLVLPTGAVMPTCWVLEWIPTMGTSKCRENAPPPASRNAGAPSKKTWLLVLTVSTTVGAERNVTRELLTNDPPTTTATSACWAAAKVEAQSIANKIARRFIKKLL